MLRTIKVNYDNGDYIITRINATISEIIKWYNLGTPVVVSEDFETGKEYRATARSIEFLDHNNSRNYWSGKRQELKRVYSISEKFMKRYDLYHKFRFTVYEYEDDLFSPKPRYITHDAAYLDGSLANFD